jgi:hypothetical protein
MVVKLKSALLTLVVVLAGAVACDKTSTTPIERGAVSVSVTPTTDTIAQAESKTFIATVTNDTTGILSGVTWSSSAPSVAAVTPGGGVVTGITQGTATITATSNFDPTKSAQAHVLVSGGSVPGGSITISPSTMPLTVGQKGTFVAAGDTSGFIWTSSVTAVATVSATGEVTAVSTGSSIIKATVKRDTSKFVQALVNVTAPAPVTLPVVGAGIVSERFTAEVAAKGNFAYTTTWGTRIAQTPGNVVKIWNVAGATPVLVDSLKNTNTGTTSDVQVSPDGSLLVVSTEGSTVGGGIVVYSLANPAAPTLISRYITAQTQRGVHTVKLSVINGKLYGFLQIDPQGGQPAQLVIVDMSNPANIQQVFAKVMGNPYVHDVFVRDGLLFAANWNDGMTIFDVGGGPKGGSPSNPVQISNIRTTTGQIHNIWWFQDPTNGNKKYVFLGEEGPTSGPIGAGGLTLGDIHVVDITDITVPKEVAKYSAGTNMGVHNFWMDEPSGILYAAYYNGGVRALNVRGDLGTCIPAQYAVHDPNNFRTISENDYLGINGQRLCDLKLMGREVGTALTSGDYFVWGVMMQGNRIYASDMGKGLVVLDISALKR